MKTSLIKLPDGSFINPNHISRIVPLDIIRAHTKGRAKGEIETLMDNGYRSAIFISGIEDPMMLKYTHDEFAQIVEDTLNSVN